MKMSLNETQSSLVTGFIAKLDCDGQISINCLKSRRVKLIGEKVRNRLRHPVDMQTGRASPQYCVRSDKLGSASEYITVPALAIGLLIVSGYL